MAKIIPRKRHSIRKTQVSELTARLTSEIDGAADQFSSERLEVVEMNTGLQIFLVDRKPLLMEYRETVFPTLKGALERPFSQRCIVVDSGAVPYVINGADVMRPGIVSVTDDVRAGGLVQIVEERHRKPIAIGVAMLDAAEIRIRTGGKMAKNIHYVGDEIWNIEF
ncbi:MAG: RNA-binding protein [Methanoregulaceae archaeon]|nr:RNA-binding protein [Methanoregulaceae archaeon]